MIMFFTNSLIKYDILYESFYINRINWKTIPEKLPDLGNWAFDRLLKMCYKLDVFGKVDLFRIQLLMYW